MAGVGWGVAKPWLVIPLSFFNRLNSPLDDTALRVRGLPYVVPGGRPVNAKWYFRNANAYGRFTKRYKTELNSALVKSVAKHSAFILSAT
jgi:hypothetical protein